VYASSLHFYRATLYLIARSLLSPGVRLSVTLVYCIQSAEDRQTSFSAG